MTGSKKDQRLGGGGGLKREYGGTFNPSFASKSLGGDLRNLEWYAHL